MVRNLIRLNSLPFFSCKLGFYIDVIYKKEMNHFNFMDFTANLFISVLSKCFENKLAFGP